MPAFEVTVPQPLYDAMAEELGEPFCDSYLYGAQLDGTKLTPRTVTAFMKLRDTWAVKKVLAEVGITLVRPEPFGSPGGSVLRDASQPDADVIRRAAKLR